MVSPPTTPLRPPIIWTLIIWFHSGPGTRLWLRIDLTIVLPAAAPDKEMFQKECLLPGARCPVRLKV